MPPAHFFRLPESGGVRRRVNLCAMTAAPSLFEFWRMAAQHHAALKGFALAHAAAWNLAARRTA